MNSSLPPLRILELGKFYAPDRGGIETLLTSWSEGFVKRGAKVDCVVAHRKAKPAEEIRSGVAVHRLASFGTVWSTSICPSYWRATRNFPADLWHAHFPNPLADLAVLAGDRRTPLVLSYHSDIIRQRLFLWAYAPVIRAVLRRATSIVVATPQHLQFSRWLQPFREKVRVIPFGLNLDRFQLSAIQLRAVDELRSQVRDSKLWLNVGRLVGYKGQVHAIRALKQVEGELWLVGSGPLEGELRRVAAEVGVTERVRFWGEVSDAELPLFYHACDALIFPSITPNEAFGLVQVEAMACGKPLLACHLESGVTYVCADGVNGLLVPPGNSEALAQSWCRLAKDPELRSRLGDNGRSRAHTEFSEPVMVGRYWELFQELTRRSA